MEVNSRVTPVAAIACLNCRRLKMKCVGSSNPPCARCAKAGRECIVQKPERTQTSGNNSNTVRQSVPCRDNDESTKSDSSRNTFLPGNGYGPPVWRKDGLGAAVSRNFFPINGVPAATGSALPSIYTTTPYTAVFSPSDHTREDTGSQSAFKRRRIETTRRQGSFQESHISTNYAPISERDMIELIGIFRIRMMIFIPLFEPNDLEDIQSIISQKPTLALCICYVTTRYVPGGDRTRSQLIPAISNILQDHYFRPQTDEEKWTMLQALSVLYAYRPTVQENAPRTEFADISHRSVKSFVESYALHLSVHNSIAGLKASIRANVPHITSTQSFKYYTYWLWLFYMSNHFSVVTGTPPSIRIDATIRAAPDILDKIDIGPGPRQILAETELCIHWDKISAHCPGLAEWWCPPDITNSLPGAINSDVLRDLDIAVDKALSSWSTKWGGAIPTEPLGQAMDFHFRFTKFCLSTYMIRNLSVGRGNINRDQQARLNNSVHAAHHFCEHLIDLGPACRDAARYMGDLGFVMVTFSCLFVIEACKHYPTVVQDTDLKLATIEEVALLMKQLTVCPNSNHGPNLQAKIILQKLHELDERDQVQPGLLEDLSSTQLPFEPNDTEGFLMDPIWDLLNFFPEVQ